MAYILCYTLFKYVLAITLVSAWEDSNTNHTPMNRSEQLQRPRKDVLGISPITRSLTESPVSRKRSIWDIEETLQPKLCLQVSAQTHPNKRSRESSFEDSSSGSPTTFLAPCTSIVSPSYSYDRASPSPGPNSRCTPTLDHGHTSWCQETVSGDESLLAPTCTRYTSFNVSYLTETPTECILSSSD